MEENFIVYKSDDQYYIAPDGILKFNDLIHIYFRGSKEDCKLYIDKYYGSTQEGE